MHDRINEPSTMAGAGLLAASFNEMLVDVPHLQAAGEAAAIVSQALLQPSIPGFMMAALGLASIFMGERGK